MFINTKRNQASALIPLAGLILAVLTSAGCNSGKSCGAGIPEDAKLTTLAEITASPDRYHGKKVLLRGLVSGQCASLCEFYYQEGKETVEIYPSGFKLPKLEKGRRVSVYAQVTSGTERVVITALGLRLE